MALLFVPLLLVVIELRWYIISGSSLNGSALILAGDVDVIIQLIVKTDAAEGL